MTLRAEYALGCDALPLVAVAAGVPAADVSLEIGPGSDERPIFAASVTGDPETIAAVEDAFDGDGHSGPAEAPQRAAALRAFVDES